MAQAWTIRRLQEWMVDYLTQRSIDSPKVCTDLLISHVLNCDRMRLYMDQERPASPEELEKLRALVKRAGQSEPIQYLVGSWSFFGCSLEVGPCTLIPRPSTEALVEEALDRLRAVRDGANDLPGLLIADLCCGTGCIAIALARSLLASRTGRRTLDWSVAQQHQLVSTLDLQIVATEIDLAAVELARRNVKSNGMDGVIEVVAGDLDAPLEGRMLEGKFDLVGANPPYISDLEWAEVPKNVRDYEPHLALRGGHDGLDIVRRTIECAPRWLKPGGSLLVEISFSHGEAAMEIARAAGLSDVRIRKDCDGLDRVLCARC